MSAKGKKFSRTRVSRYMSYLLRHNPENLRMDKHGFVDLNELLSKIRERFDVDESFIREIVYGSGKRRFEIFGDRIRALYGHTLPVDIKFEEDETIEKLYHGTTADAASKILKGGLKPMGRRWVHLSPTVEIAREVGLRRTGDPVILEVDARAAREGGIRFYKATDKVYLCDFVPPKYIRYVRLR